MAFGARDIEKIYYKVDIFEPDLVKNKCAYLCEGDYRLQLGEAFWIRAF